MTYTGPRVITHTGSHVVLHFRGFFEMTLNGDEGSSVKLQLNKQEAYFEPGRYKMTHFHAGTLFYCLLLTELTISLRQPEFWDTSTLQI